MSDARGRRRRRRRELSARGQEQPRQDLTHVSHSLDCGQLVSMGTKYIVSRDGAHESRNSRRVSHKSHERHMCATRSVAQGH